MQSQVHLISDQITLPPNWEPVHYKYSQLNFPFFNSEPLLLVIEGHPLHYDKILSLFKEVHRLGLQTQTILIDLKLSPEQLIELTNLHKPFRTITYESISNLESLLTKGLNLARKMKQDQVFFELFREQNTELKKLSIELESKIKKRQTHLEEAKRKLSETNRKATFLQDCLVIIHNSLSISELEANVTRALKDQMNILWFRIFFDNNQASLDQLGQFNTYKIPLSKGSTDYGFLLFSRPKELPFRRPEKNLLDQIGEAINLCLERTLQIEKNNELKSQWQATFNAIADPVCLIDENYNIHIANQSLTQLSGKKDVEGKKCYNILFDNDSPCKGCNRGQEFRLKSQRNPTEVYNVHSQQIPMEHRTHYFHLYRDISKQLGFERQILESAKLAELGTIGSSIAHELNNPLGGMLNFLQIIKMDLKGDEGFTAEISEMERGALKCKEIVQNLLGFSRHSNLSEIRKINLNEIIQQAVLITELRTRALGIKVNFHTPEKDIFIEGRFNQLAQAFCNVLQNSYEAIIHKKQNENSFDGLISIDISVKKTSIKVSITDNGIGLETSTLEHIFDPLFTTKDPSKNPGLGLTLAQQILQEHKASLSITPQKDRETCCLIGFQRFPNN